jgi:hypothetical protein
MMYNITCTIQQYLQYIYTKGKQHKCLCMQIYSRKETLPSPLLYTCKPAWPPASWSGYPSARCFRALKYLWHCAAYPGICHSELFLAVLAQCWKEWTIVALALASGIMAHRASSLIIPNDHTAVMRCEKWVFVHIICTMPLNDAKNKSISEVALGGWFAAYKSDILRYVS